MTTAQETLTKDVQTKATPVSVTDIIWLAIKYIRSTANLQRLLFLLSFLTYGVGDGVTAAYMMDKRGATYEVNPIVRFMYASSGAQGVIVIKIWLTFLILFSVWIISRRSNTYWTINGFLSALCVGGAMAMRANLMTAWGMTSPSASSIIMTFLILTVLFVMLGDLMDKLGSTSVRQGRAPVVSH